MHEPATGGNAARLVMPPHVQAKTSRFSIIVPSVAGGLLLVYLLFPFVFLAPVIWIFGPYQTAPPHVQTFVRTAFFPIAYLSERVPAYRLLLSKESELTGLQ